MLSSGKTAEERWRFGVLAKAEYRSTKSSCVSLHLGSSIVAADGGTYASVFVPAVRAQADFGLSFNLLLAYAVAHEVGHCLLGPGHSSAGLMRPAWNHSDAGEMSRLGLHLTKKEARKAAARLSSTVLPITQ